MDQRFPIGQFSFKGDEDNSVFDNWVEDIAWLPERIRNSIEGCSDHDLDESYRDGGWNAKELILHLVDSHLNAIIRIKLALTEDKPEIRPYDQDAWVETESKLDIPLELSLNMLENVHEKMARIFSNLTDEELKREYIHPESGAFSLRKAAALYAWHSNHHLAHINFITEKAKS
ncbi:YfiT family bacillithiol transferase [Balneola sp. MJW-20]|uniref:YfiT family bacillithiol transferase n=1 Tax=Gracilimonas aurantiaca TaxID=3234185 RepID=UPI0034655B2C